MIQVQLKCCITKSTCISIAILKPNTVAGDSKIEGIESNHTSHLGPRWPRPPHSEHIMLPVPPQPTWQKL